MAERIRRNPEMEPLEQILQTERSAELWKAVDHLDIKYRTVILLYYYNDFSTREIARITGTLEGTVKSRLYKARTLLRERLTAEQDTGQETDPEADRKKRRLCHE